MLRRGAHGDHMRRDGARAGIGGHPVPQQGAAAQRAGVRGARGDGGGGAGARVLR